MQAEVSIIMPVYNAERYLDASIGSVLSQDFRDIELICFNDASTDGSAELLRSYAARDERVRVIDSKENVKQGAGRNRGLREARGRYVMFLDADDMLAAGAVGSCVAAAREKDADVVFFNYATFAGADSGDSSKIAAGSVREISTLGHDACELGHEELRLRVAQRTASVWSAMYRRELFFDNDIFFPEKVFYEDNAIALALQLSGRRPVMVDKALYLYRVDNVSVSRSDNNPRFFDRIGSAETLMGHLKRLGHYGRFAKEVDYVFINQYLVETVFGAVYRFDKARTDKIREVRAGIRHYVPDFRKNPYYKAQPLKRRLKVEIHLRMPRVVKMLSNINRRIHGRGS